MKEKNKMKWISLVYSDVEEKKEIRHICSGDKSVMESECVCAYNCGYGCAVVEGKEKK